MKSNYTVGITGGIGSGKSYICKILENMGYPVFYADNVSKALLATAPEIISQIKVALGENAYNSDGTVNKVFIANKIFSDSNQLEKINQIMHPAVRKAFERFVKHQSCELVFNEAAILFETGGYDQFDKTILVTAPKPVKVSRLLLRNNTTIEQIESRMANQWTDDQKIPLADFVINNGESDMLLPQIERIISVIQQLPPN